MERSNIDKTKVSPMMTQYLEIKERNEEVIIFFRLGDFYEMFFEDAINVSQELELTLTGKNAGLDERIPMCGVPHHSAPMYIEKLVEKGYKVGICEQLEDAKNVKGLVKRDIVQIVSRGTVMNFESLNEKENNYIGNIIDLNYVYAVSYCDISTGEFNVFLIEHNNTKLVSEILNLGLKEIVTNETLDKRVINLLKNQFNIPVTILEDYKEIEEYNYLYSNIEDIRYITAIKQLLYYLSTTQKRELSHLQQVTIREKDTILSIDNNTKRNLELVENMRLKDRTYSLLWLLDQTKTAMGSRLLKKWIENPITNKSLLESRYDVVSTFLNEFIIATDLRKLLSNVYDLERLSGRIAFGNANGRDLIQLKNSIKVLPEIKQMLERINFHKTVDSLNDLYNLLDTSLYEEPGISIKEGFLIKSGYSDYLDELKDASRGGKDFIIKLENEEREKTGIKNLKVGYNRIFGYYIEVPRGSVHLITEEMGYERKQTLANCERYITPVLKEKETLVLGAEEKIVNLEYELFIDIRNTVKAYIPKLQAVAKVISEVDVLLSFATVTEKNNFVKPTLTLENIIDIKDARHPIVEKVIKDEYTSNDIFMDTNTSILLITGPNMSGKSTYMRSLAVITVMAQIGCFVPCKSAILPIFDKIFTRIGASDDLVSGESTFMMEMMEANNALKNATDRSLILFDELGRGTSTFDGMSLAHAILEYIHNNVKAKTLFSTHYHELTDLDETLSHLKNIHVSAHEEDGNITFLHKIKSGPADKSYGIHVAKLAQLPDSLIMRANEILMVYESEEKIRDRVIQTSLPLIETKQESKVEERLKEIDTLKVTPIEAINILYELKEMINN